MAVDLRNFNLLSDYPMDTIVYSYSNTFTRSDTTYLYTTINHGLPFTPLCFGIWSADGGSSWQQIDFTSQDGGGILSSNSTSITISITEYNGVPNSIPVKIFAFAPSTYTGAVTAPTPYSNFYINTTKTYDALIAKGTYTLYNTNSLQTVYTHNLGYVPRTMIWIEHYDGSVVSCYVSNFYDTPGYYQRDYVQIGTNRLLAYHYDTVSSPTDILHYRIYGGQNG